jgi:hypothetical protein
MYDSHARLLQWQAANLHVQGRAIGARARSENRSDQ